MNILIQKGVVVAVILLFIGVSVIPSTGTVVDKKSTIPTFYDGNTLYVGGSGPNNYTRIQDAIDNASDGDTVFVYDDSSPYYENVGVDKSINLIGEDRNTTIIDANERGLPIFLEVGYVTVTGFTLQNSGNNEYNDAGIGIKNFGLRSNWNTISGNKMVNNSDGVFMFGSDHNVISNNIIMNNRDDGIYFQGYCDNNNITGNTITMNKKNGINIQEETYTYRMEGNNISRNIISNNGNIGTNLNEFGNKFFENIVTNENIGLILGGGDQVYRNIFSNNEIGVRSKGGLWCRVKENNFLDNEQHATFVYTFSDRIFNVPFFLYPQLTKWRRNYWEGHSSGPKVIYGKMGQIPWVNFDFFPARKPYDTGE